MVPASGRWNAFFEQEERFPGAASCAIHPWENAFILIRSTPYMAKTDADGNFEMKYLPVGEHEFQFWHERTGYLGDAKFKSHAVSAKGRLIVEIEEGETVKLTGSVSAAAFAK